MGNSEFFDCIKRELLPEKSAELEDVSISFLQEKDEIVVSVNGMLLRNKYPDIPAGMMSDYRNLQVRLDEQPDKLKLAQQKLSADIHAALGQYVEALRGFYAIDVALEFQPVGIKVFHTDEKGQISDVTFKLELEEISSDSTTNKCSS